MKKQFFALLTLVLITSLLSGQKAPIKFGEVDMSDLEMKVYPGDTSASAVMLCHYGIFNYNTINFKEQIRIKILKKEGYSWADQIFPGKFGYNIKGYTISLQDGKVVKEKLKTESIFSTKVTDNYFETRFTMPDVKVGSVLDIEYTYIGIPLNWHFQETIPVRYNELNVDNGPYIKLKTNFFGYEPLAYSSGSRWVAKDMPAFKEEPFIDSKENYLTSLEFDILEFPGYTDPFAATWEDVNSNLLLNHNFRFTYSSSSILNDIVDNLKKTNKPREEMLKDAFEAVKIMKWNKRSSLYTSNQTLNAVLKVKVGNSADVNSFLYEVLKKLNFEVYPIALSTRENGRLSTFSASLNKLNSMIVLARIGDKNYFLDATEELSPYNLLPLKNLNTSGRTIDPVISDWIKMKTDSKEKELDTYDYQMDENLNLTGTLTTVRDEYAAFDFRKGYKKFNSEEEYLDNFLTDKPGLIVSSYKASNLDSIYLPVSEQFDLKVSGHVGQNGNELQFIPLLFHQLSENPFKDEGRKYPVDFGYCKNKTIIANFHIPDGYSVKQLPASMHISLPDNAASFLMGYEQSGNTLKITSRLLINKPVFLISEYKDLRKLYNQILSKHSEAIILIKNQI